MTNYDPSAVTEPPAHDAEKLNQLASGRVSGFFEWMGSTFMSALGSISEALRPLFSWNPRRD